jgi:trimeric autotransporter adhesin
MKRALRILGLMTAMWLFLAKDAVAQVPQLFNYQGIARDAGGNVLPNRVIGVELSVLDGGPTGTAVYQETFTDTTNAFGLFGLQVGGGSVVSGTFGGINWATGNKYLQTAIDLTGGTNYTLSGTTQLLSVPYALYAQNAVIGVSSGSWSLKGNAGTGDTAFIGTTDNTPLLFKTNDSASGSIRPNTNETYFGYLSGKKAVGDVLNETVGNTAFGAQTLTYTTSGAYNTAVGFEALLNCNGLGNTAFGAEAMQNTETGIYNTALGGSADIRM